MKLPERLGRRPRKPFHSAITTTFAVEFAAVEEILLPQLRASGANNLLLVADDRMAAMALTDGSRLPVALGREYARSEEHTSELQSLMRISYAVFCLTTKKTIDCMSHSYDIVPTKANEQIAKHYT